MKNKMIIAATVCFAAAGPLVAQVCDPSPSDPVPAFEAVKSAFLGGVDRKSLGPLLSKMIVTDEMWDRLETGIPEVYPNGFSGCSTFVQRREEPGFVQEIFVLEPTQSGSALFVYLSGIAFEGQIEVMSITYQTNVGLILDELR